MTSYSTSYSKYLCPRRNYSTTQKNDIRRHFNRKRLCSDINNITLTPEIVDHVLKHHQYHQNQDNTSKNIHHYNTVVSVLNSMESIEKIKFLTDYQKTDITDFEDHLETQYSHLVKRLETNAPLCGFLLTLDDLFNVVNNCTSREQPEHFNIIFDKVINRLKLYRCKSWETYLEETGIKQLISLIKSYYLDSYELYLIRNLHDNSNNINRWQFKDHLGIYYKFLAVFELEPQIRHLEDEEVMGRELVENKTNFLSTTYGQFYEEQKQDIKETNSNSIKKRIVNIVKDNTTQNTKALDRVIIDLLKIDENFRTELLKTRQISIEQ